MTYAPDDLKAIQRYCHDHTGQDWASLGIAGDAAHAASGGYHVGHDLLHAIGCAPEDPGSDYSYTESQRDRNGLTDAASAFDLGGEFDRFREITLGIVAACQRGDPRTRDIREVIYTPDGSSVRRFDRLGIRSSGDDSHLFHTHISFFRDSEGRRAADDNVLGLLKELFEGEADMQADERAALFEVRDRVRWVDGREAAEADGTDTYIDPAGKPHPNSPAAKINALAKDLAAVRSSVDKLTVGGVDLDALAAKVAEELAKRLGNG